MSKTKKLFAQRQHYLLSEKQRKEACKYGKNILQVCRWKTRCNDK